MKVVLAEKPSVARDIAAFLRVGSRRDGYFEGGGYQVTWAFGHLAELLPGVLFASAANKAVGKTRRSAIWSDIAVC